MPGLPDGWLEEVRQRSDIVDIVSEHVHLKQQGSRFWGLCPFHHEKSPSFSVSQDTQLYYCFGCHKGGTVFDFVMSLERMEFYEAALHLAERARISLPEQTKQGLSAEERERMYGAVKAAARWFHERLWTPHGRVALAYLRKRGLTDSTIRKFGIGVSGTGWTELVEHMVSEGYPEELLKTVGLAGEKNGRYYDIFRERVIFPIFNAQSRVIAFGGRIMGEGQPKYLNSSDTPLFNKRFQLYGLNFLRGQTNLARLYLVEGYMDVVSLAQSGVSGCVATLGTAITADQAKLMKRYCADIVVCYDGDSAGQNATVKAISLLEEAGAEPRVLFLPEGKDPDDFVKENGREAFEALRPMDTTEYRLNRAAAGYSLEDEEGRTRYAIDAAQILARVKNPVEVEKHLKRVAVQTGFSEAVLWQQIGQTPKIRPSGDFSKNTVTSNRYNKYTQPAQELFSEATKAERQLINFMARGYALPDRTISPADFSDPLMRRLAAFFMEESGTASTAARLLDSLPNEEDRRRAGAVFNMDIAVTQDELPKMISELCTSLRIEAIKRELAELSEQVKKADFREQLTIGKRKQALSAEIRRLDAH